MTARTTVELRAFFDWYADRYCIGLYRLTETASGRMEPTHVAEELHWHEFDQGERQAPAIELRPDEAQRLMDALWATGLRPTEHTSEGHMAAVQAHLADAKGDKDRLLAALLEHLPWKGRPEDTP